MHKTRLLLYGIKGSGLAALAMYLFDYKVKVFGVDKKDHLFTENRLIEKGIEIYSFDDVKNLDFDLIIYSSAYKDDQIRIRIDKPQIEYHEFMKILTRNQKIIGVSGTHGKTTMVGILDQMFDKKFSLIEGDGYGRYKKGRPMILECCEYQDHFLSYHPYVSIILNVELDHTDYFHNYLDYLKSFKRFIGNSKVSYVYDYYLYLLKEGIGVGKMPLSKYRYRILNKSQDGFVVDIFTPTKVFKKVMLPFLGEPYVKMTCFGLAIANLFNMDLNLALKRICLFSPVRRRMNIVRFKDTIIIDDYAHQPSQIDNMYEVVKQIDPTYKKVAIFLPDRYSRLRDFKSQFVASLSKFDEVFLINHHDDKENLLIEMTNKSSKIKFFNEKVGRDKLPTIFAFMSSKKMDEEMKIVKLNRGDLKP